MDVLEPGTKFIPPFVRGLLSRSSSPWGKAAGREAPPGKVGGNVDNKVFNTILDLSGLRGRTTARGGAPRLQVRADGVHVHPRDELDARLEHVPALLDELAEGVFGGRLLLRLGQPLLPLGRCTAHTLADDCGGAAVLAAGSPPKQITKKNGANVSKASRRALRFKTGRRHTETWESARLGTDDGRIKPWGEY
jgi:hypothetical protein